jgi:hypothetical protein
MPGHRLQWRKHEPLGVVEADREPPYLHPHVTASVRFGVSAVMITVAGDS